MVIIATTVSSLSQAYKMRKHERNQRLTPASFSTLFFSKLKAFRKQQKLNMSLGVSASPAKVVQNAGKDTTRRSANFPPSIWGDHFLQYTCDSQVKRFSSNDIPPNMKLALVLVLMILSYTTLNNLFSPPYQYIYSGGANQFK